VPFTETGYRSLVRPTEPQWTVTHQFVMVLTEHQTLL